MQILRRIGTHLQKSWVEGIADIADEPDYIVALGALGITVKPADLEVTD